MHKAAELYAKSTDHPEQLPALTLAFVGDAVYEIYVRTMMLEKSVNAHTLNKACVQLVNNRTQSALYDVLAPALDEKELGVLNRGPRASCRKMPKRGIIAAPPLWKRWSATGT